MSNAAAKLQELVQNFAMEDEKFEGGNKSAGTRARAALMEIKKFADSRRKEIQEQKNNG